MSKLVSGGFAPINSFPEYYQASPGAISVQYNKVSESNGISGYSFTGIPTSYSEIYFNLYNVGYNSGPQTPVINFRTAGGTNAYISYIHVLGSTYYSGSSATNLWIGTPYFTMVDFMLHISRVSPYVHCYRIYGNFCASSGSALIGYGKITGISSIETIYIGASGSYYFTNLTMDLSTE